MGDPAGDAPPPVGAVGALGRFDVLPGHQRQQRQRLRCPLVQAPPRRSASMIVLASLTSAETRASRAALSSQAIRGLPGSSQSWAWHAAAISSAAPGTSRRTRRTAAISWVTVSWVATASSRTTESNARRVLPLSTPVCAITCPDRVEDPLRTVRGAQPVAPHRQRRRVEPSWSIGSPQATFHRRSQRSACHRLACRSRSCSVCSTSTEAITSPGTDGRPRPDGNRSANNPSGNTSPPMLGQERVHTARRHQMPHQRRRVQQLAGPHQIYPAPTHYRSDRSMRWITDTPNYSAVS